jgi:hypothetical protein
VKPKPPILPIIDCVDMATRKGINMEALTGRSDDQQILLSREFIYGLQCNLSHDLQAIISATRELRRQHVDARVIDELVGSVGRIEGAFDAISAKCKDEQGIDSSVDRLVQDTVESLERMLETSRVMPVIMPSTNGIGIRLGPPTVVIPTMTYLVSLCCQLLAPAGGSIDFGVAREGAMVDITLEPLPRPRLSQLPPEFQTVVKTMESVGNRLRLQRNNGRLYLAVSFVASSGTETE